MEPEILRSKVYEPMLLLGKDRFQNVDIRVRVQGGGHVSQVYGNLLCVLNIELLIYNVIQLSVKLSPSQSLHTTKSVCVLYYS